MKAIATSSKKCPFCGENTTAKGTRFYKNVGRVIQRQQCIGPRGCHRYHMRDLVTGEVVSNGASSRKSARKQTEQETSPVQQRLGIASKIHAHQIVVENIRCFKSETIAPLAPLTILVGENSSGKTTLMAVARLCMELAKGNSNINFNEAPYFLGGFDQIAHHHGGRGQRCKEFSFSISYDISVNQSTTTLADTASVKCTFHSVDGQPVLKDWLFKWARFTALLQIKEGKSTAHVTLPSGKFQQTVEHINSGKSALQELDYALFMKKRSLIVDRDHGRIGEIEIDINLLRAALQSLSRRVSSINVFPYSPIRTEPQRTYEPTREKISPGGEHIPSLLARFAKDKQSKRWKALKSQLNNFGEVSGLFESIDIRQLGTRDSDPFQVVVKLDGQNGEVNITDVGYGVSQVLPILGDTLTCPPQSLFLFQQPEVHLHPRAQAQLGTLLCHQVAITGCQHIIETHSDYLIDRIRREVRNKTISSSDVSILFLERSEQGVIMHPITLDQMGQLRNTPPSYRRFFVNEELENLGIHNVPNY